MTVFKVSDKHFINPTQAKEYAEWFGLPIERVKDPDPFVFFVLDMRPWTSYHGEHYFLLDDGYSTVPVSLY